MNLVETCKAPKSVEWTDAEEKLESKAYTVERIPRPETVGNQIIWSYLIPFTLFHAMIPLAFVPYFFSWTGVILLPLGHVVFDWLGIGLCFHRVLTHGGLGTAKLTRGRSEAAEIAHQRVDAQVVEGGLHGASMGCARS